MSDNPTFSQLQINRVSEESKRAGMIINCAALFPCEECEGLLLMGWSAICSHRGIDP